MSGAVHIYIDDRVADSPTALKGCLKAVKRAVSNGVAVQIHLQNTRPLQGEAVETVAALCKEAGKSQRVGHFVESDFFEPIAQ